MDVDLANALADLYDDAEVYENYPARGLFGKTTTGLVVDSLTEFIAACITCADMLVDYDGDPMFCPSNLSIDSMGLKTIIY